VEDFDSSPGRGVGATIDGHTVEVGGPQRLLSDAIGAAEVTTTVVEWEAAGKTVVILLVDGLAHCLCR
jgi:cation transport ATPase